MLFDVTTDGFRVHDKINNQTECVGTTMVGRKNKCVRCWHLDHIVPAMYKESADDIITVYVIIERSHYTNFQPMWAAENISKSNRYVGKHCV